MQFNDINLQFKACAIADLSQVSKNHPDDQH
jgi:hypothetical protein